MLTDLLLKEIEENFDTARIDFDIHFDKADTRYGTSAENAGDSDLFGIQSVAKEAQANAKGSLHATIHIRDNTQSYIYDYDVKNDTLIRSDEDPGEFYQPLLKEDEWLKEIRQEHEEDEKNLNMNLLKLFLIGSIPFILSVIEFFVYRTERAHNVFLLCLLWELGLAIIIMLRKVRFRSIGV